MAGETKTKDMEIEKETQQQSGSGLESSSCSPDYVPFGDEWRAFVTKMRKADIVEMLRKSLMGEQIMKSELENIASASMARGNEKPVDAATGCSRHWRDSCFMHSDAEDVADHAANEAIGYRPSSRIFFLRMAIGKIADAIQQMEEDENSQDMESPQ